MLGKDIYASKYRDKSQDGIEMMHLTAPTVTDKVFKVLFSFLPLGARKRSYIRTRHDTGWSC